MTLFAGLNTWAIPLAAAASFLFGGFWYGLLSKPWLEAAGLRQDQLESPKGRSLMPFLITFAAQFVMAWMLAGVLLHLERSGTPMDAASGAITAFFIWSGFIATTLIVNHQFQMRKGALTLIDGGHWLGVVLIQGAILGAIGLA